jgi:hypothetical protein
LIQTAFYGGDDDSNEQARDRVLPILRARRGARPRLRAYASEACHRPGATAFQSHQIQNSLDTIRDVAIDANATTPPLLATATAHKVVTWHQSAITVLHARGSGWVALLTTSLDELSKDLPAAEQHTLAPYIALAKAILAGVQS